MDYLKKVKVAYVLYSVALVFTALEAAFGGLSVLAGIIRACASIYIISVGSAGFLQITNLQGRRVLIPKLTWAEHSQLMILLGGVMLVYGAFLGGIWNYYWGDLVITMGTFLSLLISVFRIKWLNFVLGFVMVVASATLLITAFELGHMREMSLQIVLFGFVLLAIAYSNSHLLQMEIKKILKIKAAYYATTMVAGSLLVLGSGVVIFDCVFGPEKFSFYVFIMAMSYLLLNFYFACGECKSLIKTISLNEARVS